MYLMNEVKIQYHLPPIHVYQQEKVQGLHCLLCISSFGFLAFSINLNYKMPQLVISCPNPSIYHLISKIEEKGHLYPKN